MDRSEVLALISLLDDADAIVRGKVTETILKQGRSLLPELQRAWDEAESYQVQNRIDDLIQEIKFSAGKDDLQGWMRNGSQNVLEGAFYVARIQFPELSYNTIDDFLEGIRKSVWLELSDGLTALEKIRILNYILFEVNRFSIAQPDPVNPDNSYLNRVIEQRKGNPVSLAILYLALAQKLELPVFAAGVPGECILVYSDPWAQTSVGDKGSEVLFYIDPGKQGAVFGREEIERIIRHRKLDPQPYYYLPGPSHELIMSLIGELVFSYEERGLKFRSNQFRALLKAITEK